jgi:peptidoglycan-associated lipoprotein
MKQNIVLLAAASLALAACAGKKQLPPPPPQAAPAPAPTDQAAFVPPAEPVGTTDVGGMQAEFARAAGSDTVLFAFDSYDLDETARQILGSQAQWLAQYSGVSALVEGHADERGTREYNLALGERRANAARNFLAAQGVDSSRLSIISYGKERPAVDGHDESAWAQNRRAKTVVAGSK